MLGFSSENENDIKRVSSEVHEYLKGKIEKYYTNLFQHQLIELKINLDGELLLSVNLGIIL